MDEDAGRTSSAASRQSVLGITPTHRETLVITIGRPVVDGRSQPSLVTTHAVRLVLTQRVAECPDDWTLDRITCVDGRPAAADNAAVVTHVVVHHLHQRVMPGHRAVI